MPGVVLTADQIDYLTHEVNDAGTAKTPPYTFSSYFTSQTVLDVVVRGQNGRQVGGQAKERNDWERSDVTFKKAVHDVIADINGRW